ncbi:MAG: 2-ketoisovalerate ferredoxin oxidoreductase [Actinobacteria bacterium RBG_16_64_13]|nr:MAG: 2-ketoisovalerate ferredoxin oxidoreductase [Actinobacteria bacterium RBG_16_64_13]
MTTKTTILTLPKEELVHPGNRACTGCGLNVAYRIGLKALGPDTILVVPPSCLTVLQGLFPVASTKLPCLNVTFASTAAAATGVLEALKAQGKEHIKVVGWAGDGGTADIGIQALSGAAERGDDFLFMCYDNEGYMNTGVQRSGTTPQWAITANTPFKGKLQQKKDVPAIMAAHGIDYVATASAAYPLDLFDKIKRALVLHGTKYIHIHTPCPPGWGFDPRYSIKIGRLAVETGYYDLYEVERGAFRLTGASEKLLEKRQLVPVADYLKTQSRFKLLTDEQIAQIQAQVDAKWSAYYLANE